jgi:hypothetical protein
LSPSEDATPLLKPGTEFHTSSLAGRGAASGGATVLKLPGLNARAVDFERVGLARELGFALLAGFDRPAGLDRAFGFVWGLDFLTAMAKD